MVQRKTVIQKIMHSINIFAIVLVHFYDLIFIHLSFTVHATLFVFAFCVLVAFYLISPEFSYRPGLSALSEDASTNNASAQSAGGPPNRPLPPTPDDDDQQGDRTLIMKRVRIVSFVSEPISMEMWMEKKKENNFAVCFSESYDRSARIELFHIFFLNSF